MIGKRTMELAKMDPDGEGREKGRRNFLEYTY